MAKKTVKAEGDTAVKELSRELKRLITDIFGNCSETDGMFRTVADGLGVVNSQVIVDAALEGGTDEDDPFSLLHFVATIAENIPDAALPDLRISLNDLNHEVSCGAYPGFGTFCYYEPLNQIYLSYRLPVSFKDLKTQYGNIRFYLTGLYDQLDLFVDYIMFAIASPGSVSITDYMSYLDKVQDPDDTEERMDAFLESFGELLEDKEAVGDKE